MIKDDELLKLHHGRLGADHYADPAYHLLTQDIIYATVDNEWQMEPVEEEPFDIKVMDDEGIEVVVPPPYSGKAIKTDFLKLAVSQKVLGNLGEQAVLDYERRKLYELQPELHPVWTAKEKGDGLGYDIDSFDLDGTPIVIEVKTTRTAQAPFYISDRELEASKSYGERYCLYRLFDFDEHTRRCKMIIHRGSLECFCTHPVSYKVNYKRSPINQHVKKVSY
ncbi:DUF3883 domain-containing protein [Chitinophaga sedimenti]|uniref:DUF3883 domain-containing protein n=1 Tax=Chitinophaga sedimenti TaxID=2033606 RepID=UPI002002A94B|nr:DUF3883 domain-containing protein [Chitinophaga sedimenti]MCK7559405.1 DUF3883 domain-containing protein [Chitinophaga sedimenti]